MAAFRNRPGGRELLAVIGVPRVVAVEDAEGEPIVVHSRSRRMPPEDPLTRLHRDLGLNRLSLLWAKLEILFGLFAAAAGFVCGLRFAVLPEGQVPPWAWTGPVLLMTLGGYLALAGQRSHLYQSNNRLAAHLAELIRTQQPKPENCP